jgi:hypothetical protein
MNRHRIPKPDDLTVVSIPTAATVDPLPSTAPHPQTERHFVSCPCLRHSSPLAGSAVVATPAPKMSVIGIPPSTNHSGGPRQRVSSTRLQ